MAERASLFPALDRSSGGKSFSEAFDQGKLPQYDETPPSEDEEW